MITGDNTLTACQVAKELAIIDLPALILTRTPSPSNDDIINYNWISVNGAAVIPFNDPAQPISKLVNHFDLCVSGDSLSALLLSKHEKNSLHHVKVFARVSPEQKDLIVTSLKQAGYVTLMAGDGTNDVGALKQAHIGKCIFFLLQI